MATTLKFRRYTTAEISALTGAEGELFVDLDKDVVVINDGSTAGGHPLQAELVSGTNIKTVNGASILGSGNIDIDSDILSYLTTNSYATQTYVGTQISNLLDGAPEALNTLNELAAALNDDSDFASTVTSQITAAAYTAAKFDSDFGDQTTDALTEGSTNLYYTSARVDSDITNLVDSDYVSLRSPPGGAFTTYCNGGYSNSNNIWSNSLGHTTVCGGTRNNIWAGETIANTTQEFCRNIFMGCKIATCSTHARDNVFLGTEAGECMRCGERNVIFGCGAARESGTTENYNATNNVIIGTCAAKKSMGTNNVVLGWNAACNQSCSSSYNVFLGFLAGKNACAAVNNVAIGKQTFGGYSSSAGCGQGSVYIGDCAGANHTNGSYNVAIGPWALFTGSEGNSTAVGRDAGRSVTGPNNVFLGYNAGYGASSTTCCTIFLGGPTHTFLKMPGVATGATNGDVLTYNSSTGNVEFAASSGGGLDSDGNGLVTIDADLTVTGTVSGDVFVTTSDERLKSNIETIVGALEKVKLLRGVSYNMNGESQIGVIAQEIQEIIPEVVLADQNGQLSVAYGNIIGLLIEAIKEQQVQIENLQK